MNRIGLLFAVAALVGIPAVGSAQSASSVIVDATVRPPYGVDSGTTIAPGARLRITASGSLSLGIAIGGCGLAIGPAGCSSEISAPRPQAIAAFGALLGTFVDMEGRALAPPFAIGEGAFIIAPTVLSKLYFRINAFVEHAGGALTVTTAAVQIAPAIGHASGLPSRTVTRLAIGRRTLGSRPAPGFGRSTIETGRSLAHIVANRLTFGMTPAQIDAIAKTGVSAWLDGQLAPAAIDDSAMEAMLEPAPSMLDIQGNIIDSDGFERRLVFREVLSNRQVQEKMVLHWLEHFSVGVAKVADPSLMAHYEATVRADAFGNFKQLLVDVTKEPAMLYWLDNNLNDGSDPTRHPNENFGREFMQLFVLGTNRLNVDGSPLRDVSGNAIPAYTQADVVNVSYALSGLGVVYNGNPNPNKRFGVAFSADAHPLAGPRTLIGTTINDPGNESSIALAIDALVRQPSTAPFEARELIQRFVTAVPSPRYVASIAAVWSQSVDASDQLAQVMRALVRDPEFSQSALTQLKEPIESAIGSLRPLGVVPIRGRDGGGAAIGPMSEFAGAYGVLAAQREEPYNPNSVFSFYRPGHKDSLYSQQALIRRINDFTSFVDTRSGDPGSTATLDIPALLQTIGSTSHAVITGYLLDALVSGGTPQLAATVDTYLQNGVDDAHVRGAIWLTLTAPEFEVQ